MKRISCLLLLVCVVLPTHAQDAAEADLSQNAALRYWMAFSFLPHSGEERYETLQAWDEITIEEAKAFFAPEHAMDSVLEHLAWGAHAAGCIWAIDRKAGPYALLPHLGPARALARLAMMRARVRLHDGDATGAAEDILTVMEFSRAFDSDRLLISSLVGVSIEAMAVRFTAEHLSAFDDEAISQLRDGLAQLPVRPALSAAIQGESDTFLGWFEQWLLDAKADGADHEELQRMATELGFPAAEGDGLPLDIDQWLAWVDEAKDAYTEAGRVIDLPYDAYGAAVGELESGFMETENRVIELFIPSVSAVRMTSDTAHARHAMLEAMFAIRLDDDDTDLADHPAMQDPFGDGTFEMVIERDDETGELVYGLRSALPGRDGQPVELPTDAPLTGQR